jgi:lysyl-tRNA synthetase class 2
MEKQLDQEVVRREKFEALKARGIEVFPHEYRHTHTVCGAVAAFGPRSKEELEAAPPAASVPGRVLSIREHGKSCFLDLSDGRQRLQAYFKKDGVGEACWEALRLLDLGDIIGVEGTLFRTRTGELTLQAARFVFLAKCFRPLPEKHFDAAEVEAGQRKRFLEFKDPEARHRKRHLDFLCNPEVRDIFELRARLLRELRAFFDARGYLEVETPMLQTLAGGAAAKPFATHHNALDLDLYLRIAPELFLKRLVIGGFDRVYEINRNFRNEGISTRHNPEFTMLEFYQAYANYEDLMALTEELLEGRTRTLLGTTEVEWNGRTLSFRAPFARVAIPEAVREHAPGHPDPADGERLLALLKEHGVEPEDRSPAHVLIAAFEAFAEPLYAQPTFITHFPRAVSPLAKWGPDGYAHRFELLAGGMELANAYCELADPEEQGLRFREQVEQRQGRQVDEEYLEALAYGLPPTAGEGIGIDRLVMLLTGKTSIREVILFPLLRPRD